MKEVDQKLYLQMRRAGTHILQHLPSHIQLLSLLEMPQHTGDKLKKYSACWKETKGLMPRARMRANHSYFSLTFMGFVPP